MKRVTFGLAAGVCSLLCAASNAHADTVKMIGASSMSGAELTPNEMTRVFFDANPQPHTPSNPTTSTLIVPAEVGPLFNSDRHAPAATQIAPNSPRDNVPVDPPMPANGGGSNAALMLAALGFMPQSEESSASAPSFENPLPSTFVLFGTALIGLSVLVGRRRKRLSA